MGGLVGNVMAKCGGHLLTDVGEFLCGACATQDGGAIAHTSELERNRTVLEHHRMRSEVNRVLFDGRGLCW
jgi:hypothetical protein